MATSQNPGGPDPQQSAKITAQDLKDILRLNGDYNNQLKENIKDLDQQIKAFESIISGKAETVWDGIHGFVVAIKLQNSL